MTQLTGSKKRAGLFRHSIRFQLLLLSLVLLLIPWSGYRYLQEMEVFLRQIQSNQLQQTAEAAALAAHYQEDLFSLNTDGEGRYLADSNILLHQLESSIQLDGYDEDWLPYLPDRASYTGNGNLKLNLLAGNRGEYLYLLFDVIDDQHIAWQPQLENELAGDVIELALEHPDGRFSRYRFSSALPGWVAAYREQREEWIQEPRIRGEQQFHASGYRLELRIPGYLVGDRLAFRAIDVDDPGREIVSEHLQSASLDDIRTWGRLIGESSQLRAAIAPLIQPGMRIWVVDRAGRVLASKGDLKSRNLALEQNQEGIFNAILKRVIRMTLGHPGIGFQDRLAGRRLIDTPELAAIWLGAPKASGRLSSGKQAVVESIARPVTTVDGVIGAVLVQQSSSEILTLQSEAARKLLVYSLVLIVGITLLLLGFATVLVVRVRRLRDRLEAAVNSEGRIQGELSEARSKDEIGDLQRSFKGVMRRLQEYNTYLEAMASRLAHELKTPLSITRSSIENLQLLETTSEQNIYIERAQQGVHRLSLIIDRMREASRLEQSIESAELKRTDLRPMLAQLIAGYRTAYPHQTFELFNSEVPLWVFADSDLLCQALEKLLANALDFRTSGSAITVSSEQRKPGQAIIRVVNTGPLLSGELQRRLFQAMVSDRELDNDQPHLGLGLYLVRLIAEFHRGGISALNLDDNSGVAFELQLPSANS